MDFAVDFSVYEGGRKAPQWTLEGDLSGKMSFQDLLDFTKQNLILVADAALREEQQAGFDKKPVVLVDGNQGKAVINVNPLGKIEFVARADLSEILTKTYQSILDRSPVLTGRYKATNIVYFKGTPVANDMPSLQEWLSSDPQFEQNDFIRFVDFQPYARKLERQGVTYGNQRYSSRSARYVKGRRGLQVLAPNGVYYLTYRSIRSKYKQNSVIKFEFVSGAQFQVKGEFQPKKGKPGRAYLYPSILISVAENGVL